MIRENMVHTVALASAQPGWGRGLVATLPRSLRLAAGSGTADIVLVDGAPDWPGRAHEALERGIGRIMVLDPSACDPAAVDRLAQVVDRTGAEFSLSGALADSPALPGFSEHLEDVAGELVVDGAIAGRLSDLLLTKLRLFRALGMRSPQLGAIGITPAAYIIEGEAGGEAPRLLRLTGALGREGTTLSVTLYGPERIARLVRRGDAPARPVEVMLSDAAGLRRLPAIHEGGHRHALRTLLASTDRVRGSAPLQAFAHDLALVGELLGAR